MFAARSLATELADGSVSKNLVKTIEELEGLRAKIDIPKYLEWLGKRVGVAFTPLREAPQEINPYLNHGIRILYKPEYLNPSGSGKDRPVSFMLYYCKELGLLDGIKKITTAGYGNFIRSFPTILPFFDLDIVPEAYMGKILLGENRDLIDYLRSSGVMIHGCEDEYCPTSDSERGKAISLAYVEEKVHPETTRFFDQHGYFKPFDGLLNAAGYYFSLSPEVLHQTEGMQSLYYVSGQGTRGSLVGTGVGIKKMRREAKIIGLRQEEGGHIFGLRSLKELGKSDSLGWAEELCDMVYKISDKEAFATMKNLWEVGIPATPSGGGYIAGALRWAKKLYEDHREGAIVTLVFDSVEYYGSILRMWTPKILGINFQSYYETFEALKTQAYKEREEHVRKLKSGENQLFNLMITR